MFDSFTWSYSVTDTNHCLIHIVGKTTQEIQASRRRVWLNQYIKTSTDDESEAKILWSPDDHSFFKGDVETTVTKHYSDSYDIELVSVKLSCLLLLGQRYILIRIMALQNRDLPIVYLGKRVGWLPLQFAYQSFEKTKDSNENDMVR